MQLISINQDRLLIEPLTPRELEVLQLVCKLYTNREIADKMNCGLRTIEGYKTTIRQKFYGMPWKDIYNEAKEMGII